jgi:23S rRNA (guanosine2251-2'-O)-methyltransferase
LRTVHFNPQAAKRLGRLLDAAAAAGVPVETADDKALTMMAGTARHQGVVATSGAFPYVELDHVVANKPDLVVLADQMQDPQNLGALLRTAEAVAAGAVIVPKDGSVPVTAAVEAAAAGAAALVPVCRVTNGARALRSLKGSGYWAAGLAPRDGTDLFQFAPPRPLAVVVGGEAGMRPLVARHCDFLLSIPVLGRIESLNASVAVGVALYHVRRHWGCLDRKSTLL